MRENVGSENGLTSPARASVGHARMVRLVAEPLRLVKYGTADRKFVRVWQAHLW